MKFNKYFFENYPMDTPFDMNNPRYVLSLDGVDEILDIISSSKPYSLTINDFDNQNLVSALLHIDVLQNKDNKLAIAVPFFLERDAKVLKELSKKVANEISNDILLHKDKIIEIINQNDNGYSYDRNLYHLLCGYIFDGLMFDYLEENQLVTTSLVHKTELDYLVILYEDSNVLNEYSDLLLCSYNRLISDGKGFASFGDSNGYRKDFYRYKRLNELNKLTEIETNYIDISIEELIINFEKLVDGSKIDSKFIEIFNYFGYCKNNDIIVPVYDETSYKVANDLYKYVLEITKKTINNALSIIEKEDRLTAIAHRVNKKDIANEIYHLIFGEVNERLVESGLVANPKHIDGEGRYFKSFER